MEVQAPINMSLAHLFNTMANYIVPIMFAVFVVAVFMRLSLFWVIRSKLRFAREFAVRLHFYLRAVAQGEAPRVGSFSRLIRALLEKTYLECFEINDRYKLRSLDKVETLADRLFMLHAALQRFVEDLVVHLGYLKKSVERSGRADFQDIIRSSFDTNPYFSRVFGVLPISTVNELLATLPGLFLVLGIFGTFLGIAAGLPELGNMDLSNIENTKKVMDGFLVHISAAMFKSIVGIALSAAMGILNTLLAVETTYYTAVTRLSDSLSLAWQETDINERVAPSSHSIPTQASGKPEKASA
jgi:hypothetical protein